MSLALAVSACRGKRGARAITGACRQFDRHTSLLPPPLPPLLLLLLLLLRGTDQRSARKLYFSPIPCSRLLTLERPQDFG